MTDFSNKMLKFIKNINFSNIKLLNIRKNKLKSIEGLTTINMHSLQRLWLD